MKNSNANSEAIDKQLLYRDFRDHQNARNKLNMKAAYKSLDIPDDDMDIRADNSRHGISSIAAVALGGLPLAAYLLAGLAGGDDPSGTPASSAPAPPTVAAPPDQPDRSQTDRRVYDVRIGEPYTRSSRERDD